MSLFVSIKVRYAASYVDSLVILFLCISPKKAVIY